MSATVRPPGPHLGLPEHLPQRSAPLGHHVAQLTGQLGELARVAPELRGAGARHIATAWWLATRLDHDEPSIQALGEVLETAAYTAQGPDRAAAVALLAALLTDTSVAITTPWGEVSLPVYGISRFLAPSEEIAAEHRPQQLLRDALESLPPGHLEPHFMAAARLVWQSDRDRFPALLGLAREFRCRNLLDRVATMNDLDAWLLAARGQRNDEVAQILARPDHLTRRQLQRAIGIAATAQVPEAVPALHRIHQNDTRRGMQRAAAQALETIGRHDTYAARAALAPLLLEAQGRRARRLRRELQRQLQQLAVLQARARLASSIPTTGRPALPDSAFARDTYPSTTFSDAVAALVAPHGTLCVERTRRVHMHYNRWWSIDLPDPADVARIPAWLETIGALAYPDAHRPVHLGIDGISFTIDPSGITPEVQEQITTWMHNSGLPPVLFLNRLEPDAPTLLQAHSTYPPTIQLCHPVPTTTSDAAALGTALHAQLRALAIALPRPLDVAIDLTVEGAMTPTLIEPIWEIMAPIARDREHLQAGPQRQINRDTLRSPLLRWAAGGAALAGLLAIMEAYTTLSVGIRDWAHVLPLIGMLIGIGRAGHPDAIQAEHDAARFPERLRLQVGGHPLFEIVRDIGMYGSFDACTIQFNRDHPLALALFHNWDLDAPAPAELTALAPIALPPHP